MNQKKTREESKKGQDLLFRRPYVLIMTLSITSLNFLITYDFEKIDILFAYYFLVDLLTTYLIIEFYALGILFLNKRYPLRDDFVKRFNYQLTLQTLSVILFTIFLNEFFDFLFFERQRLSLSFVFYTKDTFVALLFILLLHAIYFGLFLMSNKENLESLKIVPEVKVKVADAHSFKFLSPHEILLVYSAFGVTYVITKDYCRYNSDFTLKRFEQILNENFFRANRKSILSKEVIDSYKSASNGKVEVLLKENKLIDMPQVITVSRDRASSFRSWLNFE